MLAMIKLFFFNRPDLEVKRIHDEILDRRADLKNRLF
jgi:hypothetical protein